MKTNRETYLETAAQLREWQGILAGSSERMAMPWSEAEYQEAMWTVAVAFNRVRHYKEQIRRMVQHG